MQTYFQSLNYSMANEDTTLEYELARKQSAKNILTVGGSGSRALPFLALPIESLTIVDVSPDQLLLIELKLQTIKQLEHKDAITFWTSEDAATREAIFQKLKLDQKFRDFYHFHVKQNPKLAPLYWGKWEKTFRTFSKLVSLFFSKGVREAAFKTDKPAAFFKDHIRGFKWDTIIKIVGNKAMFNSILYKGSFIQKNSALSYFEYYSQAFERLFALDIRRSHFLQLCLCGKVVREEGLPIEFDPILFARIKASNIAPIYQQGSVFERPEATLYDFVSLSDVPSYLSGEIEKNYLQMIKKNVADSGVVVNRFYLRTTEQTNESGYKDITQEHSGIISQELVQMYQVQLLQKTGHGS
jgi:S-adenosylmethionine-diacylglycerol 3-amino-3-carboxypropyl transferase